MTNQTIDLILKMRDEASAVWKKTNATISGGVAGLKNAFSNLRNIIAAAFVIGAVKKFIDASNAQEQASARLGQALRNAGIHSKEAQAQMEAYSSALQKVTTFGDETVTEVQTLLVAMTGSTYRVDELTKATLDLASGLHMDAASVAQLIGKTLEGQDALGRYGITTKNAEGETAKLAAIIDQAREKFGGFAENEAKTAAGQMKQFANAVGDLEEDLGNALKDALLPFVEFLNRNMPTIRALIISMTEGFSSAFNVLVAGIAWVAQKWNELLAAFGNEQAQKDALTWAQVYNDAMTKSKESGDKIREVWREATTQQAAATREAEIYARTVTQNEQQPALLLQVKTTEDLGNAWIDAKGKMHSYSLALTNDLKAAAIKSNQEIKAVTTETFNWLSASIEQFQEENERASATYTAIMQGMVNAISESIAGVFEGEAANGKKFLKSLLLSFIDMVQGMIIAAEAAALAKAVGSWGATLLQDLPWIAAATIALQTAKAFVARMHEGGTAFINAPPSKEVPILVRGGETVRVNTEEQERNRSGSGATVIVNINAPGTPERMVKRAVQDGLRASGLSLTDYFQNTKKTITLP